MGRLAAPSSVVCCPGDAEVLSLADGPRFEISCCLPQDDSILLCIVVQENGKPNLVMQHGKRMVISSKLI